MLTSQNLFVYTGLSSITGFFVKSPDSGVSNGVATPELKQ